MDTVSCPTVPRSCGQTSLQFITSGQDKCPGFAICLEAITHSGHTLSGTPASPRDTEVVAAGSILAHHVHTQRAEGMRACSLSASPNISQNRSQAMETPTVGSSSYLS